MNIETINKIIRINLTAPMLLSRFLLPEMIKRKQGHIVNISSLSGLVGTPYDETYSATKHGLVGFSRSLRVTAIGESYPVGVSVICPGFISGTGMWFDFEQNSKLKVPSVIGTSLPQKVANAVIKAIIKNKPEIIVNSSPMKPFLLIQSLAPSLAPWLTRVTGTISLTKNIAEYTKKSGYSKL